MYTFSASDRRKVTKDWQVLFPDLGIYRPMHLLNRLGPILVGIALETDRGNSFYEPSFHVHNLCRQFPAVTLTLQADWGKGIVRPFYHEKKHKENADAMLEKARIPFSGDVSLEKVLKAYEEYFKKPDISQYVEFEDYALLCGWSGDASKIKHALKVVHSYLKNWPEERYFRDEGGFNNWFTSLEKRVMDRKTLIETVEKQIIELKVDKLPARSLLINGHS